LLDAAARVANASPSEASASDQRFPRSCRLTARRQFVDVYDRGRKARRTAFTIFGLPNAVGHSRVGLTVTRRTGGAVVRNRAKRVLRDLFRRHRHALPGSMDLVINAHPAILTMRRAQIERDLLGAVAELARRPPSRPEAG
jgi:ribonuclease P protein component